jgi:protein TonB
MNSAPISAPPSSDVGAPGQFNAAGYALHSDLAQFCLPSANRDAYRKLAYVNSICSLFLAIGLAGINPPVLEQKVPEPVQLFVPVEIVQPPEPPKTEPQPQEQNPEPQPDTPVVMPQIATVVAADPTQVKFAVPVEGPVVFAPAKFAQAPPPAPPKPTGPPQPTRFVPGQDGGSYPPVKYPAVAQQQRLQGSVVLNIIVDTNGLPASVEIKTSSGYSLLDRNARDTIKNKWRWPPGETRYYYWEFEYQLK